MRKNIIIGNWKMNLSLAQAGEFVAKMDSRVPTNLQVGLAGQFLHLERMKDNASGLLIGAQNVNDHESGAYTGEVSVDLLKEIEMDFCIVGHSERRTYYNETNQSVNAKAKLLQEKHIIPVICVGETESEYDAGQTQMVIDKQIKESCVDLDVNKIIVAYEPVWAIGTGKSANAQIAQNICSQIRAILATMYDTKSSEEVRILYGGSVNEENISEYLSCDDVDGALVGGASLKVDSFTKLVNYSNE